jgi:hypothetical protein
MASFPSHFADATHQSFDADEIMIRPAFGEVHQERAVTTAKFHLQGLGDRKELGQLQSFENGRQFKNETLAFGVHQIAEWMADIDQRLCLSST